MAVVRARRLALAVRTVLGVLVEQPGTFARHAPPSPPVPGQSRCGGPARRRPGRPGSVCPLSRTGSVCPRSRTGSGCPRSRTSSICCRLGSARPALRPLALLTALARCGLARRRARCGLARWWARCVTSARSTGAGSAGPCSASTLGPGTGPARTISPWASGGGCCSSTLPFTTPPGTFVPGVPGGTGPGAIGPSAASTGSRSARGGATPAAIGGGVPGALTVWSAGTPRSCVPGHPTSVPTPWGSPTAPLGPVPGAPCYNVDLPDLGKIRYQRDDRHRKLTFLSRPSGYSFGCEEGDAP
jgi:hypothetical protein